MSGTRWKERRQCSDEEILRRALVSKDGTIRIPMRPVPRRIKKDKLWKIRFCLPILRATIPDIGPSVFVNCHIIETGNTFTSSSGLSVAEPSEYGMVRVQVIEPPPTVP